MNCPGCGKEMTAGMLQSARAVYFADENYEHLLFRPNEHMALLTRDNFTGPTGTAWRCRDCKKVVVDYTDIPQSNLKIYYNIKLGGDPHEQSQRIAQDL